MAQKRGRVSSSPPELSSGSLIEELRLAKEAAAAAKETEAATGDPDVQHDAGNLFRITVESTLSRYKGREVVSVNSDDRVSKLIEEFLSKAGIDIDHTFILRESRGLTLKNSKTIAEAGLKTDDTVYLSTVESERALFSYTNWWYIAGLCLAFSMGLCIVSLVAFMLNRPSPPVYGVIVDAGSVHTAIFTYRFNRAAASVEGEGWIDEMHRCEGSSQGISSFANRPREELVAFLNSSCLRDSIAKVPDSAKSTSILQLGSTAGMRMLQLKDPQAAAALTESIQEILSSLGGTMKANVTIFDGNTEGLMSWLAVNYLANSLLGESWEQSAGALDWGGASTQIAVQVEEATAAKVGEVETVSLMGKNFSLLVRSHMCYGQQEGSTRHQASLLYSAYLGNKSLPRTVADPCAPVGSSMEVRVSQLMDCLCTRMKDREFMSLTESEGDVLVVFQGTGEGHRCGELAQDIIDVDKCQTRFVEPATTDECLDPRLIPAPTQQTYYAFSTYWHLVTALGLPESHSLQDFDAKLYILCNATREELTALGLAEEMHTACFKANLMRALLLTAYHFDSKTYPRIKFTRQLGSAEAGWTLGSMILASNTIHAEDQIIHLSLTMFVVLEIIGAVLFVLSLFFARQARLVSTASTKYQRFAPNP